MSQRGYTPLDTPFTMRHDRNGQKPTNQFVKPENKKNKHGIYKHSNQQSERLG